MAQRSRGRNNWRLAYRPQAARGFQRGVAWKNGAYQEDGAPQRNGLLMSRSERTPAPANVTPIGIEAGVAFGFEITIDALAASASAERLRTPDDAIAAGFGGEGSHCEA
jgi:hypothetical protein